jgi:hypothetical protein
MTTARDTPGVCGGNADGPDLFDRIEAARIAMRCYFEAAGTSRSLLQTLAASELFTV